jgi:hypothetical protein
VKKLLIFFNNRKVFSQLTWNVIRKRPKLQEGSEESSLDCGGLRKVESRDQDLSILPGVFIKKFGHFPTFSPLAKLCQKNVVKSVSRFINDEVSNNGHAQEVEVADEV